MSKNLSIVVVEKDRERALMIVDRLRDAGEFDVVVIGEESGLARRIAERNLDLVSIDAENPSRDVLENRTLGAAPLQRPVAIFIDQSNAAIGAGMSAYAPDGLRPVWLEPIMDAAIARFHMVHKMRVELAETRSALEERKVIDRAKGILMRARGIDEDEAYGLTRKAAMVQGKKVADLAKALVIATNLLKRNQRQ